jgi:hypothetical protein
LNGIGLAVDFISLWKNLFDLLLGNENEVVTKMRKSSKEIEINMVFNIF